MPRKAAFEAELQLPMTQLMLAIESEMKKNKVPLLTKPKAIVSRIYRDVRFSANKSPYHNFIGASLHRNGGKTAPGVLYVHVAEKEQFAAVGFWQPERPILTNWRLQMQAKPKVFLEIVKQLKSKKLELADTHKLQRMPRGFEAQESSAIGEYLKFQSFIVMHKLTKAEAMAPELPRQISRFALDALPLLKYGWAIPEAKPTVFLD